MFDIPIILTIKALGILVKVILFTVIVDELNKGILEPLILIVLPETPEPQTIVRFLIVTPSYISGSNVKVTFDAFVLKYLYVTKLYGKDVDELKICDGRIM